MRLSLFAVVPLLSCSFAAHADTLTTFDLNVPLVNSDYGSSLAGTVVIDETLGKVANVDVMSGGGGLNETFNFISSQGQSSASYMVGTSGNFSDHFTFNIPTVDLKAYTGSPISGTLEGTVAGTLTLAPVSASVTPEPSSLALLGTGLLAVVGAMKRRLA